MRVSLDLDVWSTAPLDELLDHLVAAYVRPLAESVDRVGAALRAARAPDSASELLAALRELTADHLRREEDLVFPWLRRGNRAAAAMLVAVLEREHEKMTLFAGTLRTLISPGAVCGAPVDRSLDDLERLLSGHVQLENDVLFPRALAAGSHGA